MSGTLEDLKQRIKDIPISEIMGLYIHTVRKGTQTLAVCPFHDDSNPSLNINDQKGMWFCFVDNMGGDIIKFVMLFRKIDFKEALQDICEKLGWNFDDYHRPRKASPKIEMGKKLLTNSMKLYKKVGESKNNQAFQEFLEKRGISEELAKTYQLGFSPSNRALFEYLNSIKEEKERSFAIKTAEEVGLIKKSTYGEKSHYDTFRDRIMFPIWDQFGQVTGFTSRAISDDQKPKYLNSFDSFVFNKKNILYGLHLAKNFIRERGEAILVEGNMDQIALYKNGFEQSIAIMGTALGDNSLTKLLALTKNIVLGLDNDTAGWNAGVRINAQFMEKGLTPRSIELGQYKDPDEFLIAEGRDAMAKKIEESRPFIDIQIEKFLPKKMPELAERKLDLLREVFAALSPLKDSLSAKERVVIYSKRIGLQADPATITKSYVDFLSTQNSKLVPNKAQNPNQEHPGDFQNNYPSSQNLSKEKVELDRKVNTVEAHLLQNLVQNPELLLRKEISELLDFVGNDEVKRYILKLCELMYEIDETEYESVIQSLTNNGEYSAELSAVVGGALFRYRENSLDEKVLARMVEDVKKKLQIEQLKVEKKFLKDQHSRAQTEEEQEEILSQLLQVDKKLAEVKTAPRNTKTTL